MSYLNKRFPVYKIPRTFWLWMILAQFSFLTTIGLPYQGEEAVYTITSMEMIVNHDWSVPTQYGVNYARPPLYNWLILPLAYVLGWHNILIASRLIAAMATLLSSFLLGWLVERLFKNRSLSLLTALAYMSGDVLFRRGWLAYADPLFSLFVFAAIAFLWIGLQKKQSHYFCFAAVALIASFLTKALTGYIFYGIAALVLFWREPERKLLFKPTSLIAHGTSFLFPLLWNSYFSEGAHVGSMVYHVTAKLSLTNINQYFIKITLFPMETFLRCLPLSLLVCLFLIERKYKKGSLTVLFDPKIVTALWILGLNYLPYWLAPESHIRYLMPLYPLLALVLTSILWKLGEEKIKIVYAWLIMGIILRYLVGLWVLPYYEKHYRGDYKTVALDILTTVQNQPLFVEDYSATGLSVVAYLDAHIMPTSYLKQPDLDWKEGFLIANEIIPHTKIKKTYRLGNHSLYLLCRGKICH